MTSKEIKDCIFRSESSRENIEWFVHSKRLFAILCHTVDFSVVKITKEDYEKSKQNGSTPFVQSELYVTKYGKVEPWDILNYSKFYFNSRRETFQVLKEMLKK